MKKWEYKVYIANVSNVFTARPPEDLGAVLDANGAQGWELVKIEPINRRGWVGGSFTDKFVLFFKRPVEAEESGS